VAAKVEGIAGFVASKIERATKLGIPLDQLPGVVDYFAGIKAHHPEVAALRLIDGGGQPLAAHGQAVGPWIERSAGPARVAVSADEGFVARRLEELAADIGILLLVAVLVFRELLAALLGRLPSGGGTATGDQLQSLRLPLFLFILTEEMSRAFLPLYIKSFAGGGFLGQEAEVGLPIAIYMLCFALATPFAGRWADRWGVARVFAAGVGLSLVGFAWTALVTDYWQLLPARALCACGYAVGTMACQRQLIALTAPAERARGLAMFVGAVGIAAICGAALGGVLADQIGFRPVFAVSALLALLAFVVFRFTLGGAGKYGDAGPPLRLAEVLRLMSDRRFAVLMLGGAIPAKIALAGFLFFLTPLALHQLDYSPAAIGRAVMLYFILVAAINPVASWLSDRHGWRLSLTLIGGTLIGIGGLAGWLGTAINEEQAVWIGIATLGIGTGLATAPMQALASEIGARAGASSVAVVLRTVERLGSVIGPLWAGVWLAATGWSGAMAAIGLTVLAGTLLCLAARDGRTP
jgi:MFS family permease